jgi:peptide/nickel transport system ATP-binding protein/oligopeptide transport system ATP-binding protein
MSPPLLEVRDLVKHFVARRSLTGRAREVVKAVDGVSFSLNAGETYALVGESGCGKSTVGRLVLRLIDPTAGSVAYEGRPLEKLGPHALREFRAEAQLIFQDPYASLNPRMTVGEMLAEPIALHSGLSRQDRQERVAELLKTVGLEAGHARRYPHEFSGGQRQRIAIARALAVGPKLIVCDEPVSALDVSIRSQILNLLKDLQHKLGLAYVFISHDLAVVKHIAHRVGVMYLGRVVEEGPADMLFHEPRHPYTQALLSAIPVASPVTRRERRLLPGDPPSPIAPPPGCHLHTRCPHAIERCRSERPLLVGEGARSVACHLWRDIARGDERLPREIEPSPSLVRLFRAFADRPVDAEDRGAPIPVSTMEVER